MLTQLQNTPSDLGLSLQATPTLVRSGQAVRVAVKMRNPRHNEQVQLQAVATYSDSTGKQYTAYSNVVTLTIDYSLPIRLEVPLQPLTFVPASATFDGKVIDVSSSNADPLRVDLVLPADGNEHVLEFGVMR